MVMEAHDVANALSTKAVGVIFDLGGTLGRVSHPIGNASVEALRDFLQSNLHTKPIANSIFDRFYEKVNAFNTLKNESDECKDEFIYVDCMADVLESANIRGFSTKKCHEVAVEAMKAYYKPEVELWIRFDGVLEMLEELSSRGVRLAMVSNSSDSPKQQAIIDRLDLRRFFPIIVLSSDMGIRKPNVEIFQKVLSIWKLRPEQTIMVGDMLNRDVIGSKRAGIYSIWLTPYAGNVACNERFKNSIIPDCTVNSIPELALAISNRL